MLRGLCRFAVLAGVALASGPALADSVPVLSVDLSVGGVSVWSPDVVGTIPDPEDPNSVTWTDGSWSGSGVTIQWWGVEGDLDPFVSGNWAITNTSGSTQIFTLTVDLPVAPVLPSSLMYGSSSITVADANGIGGATLASVTTSALYNGRIDFAVVSPATDLFGPGYSLVAGLLSTNSATQSFGTAPGSVPGPGVTTAIGIQHFFSLTAGDRATFNSIFSVVAVPEPGALLLLVAGGGLLALRFGARH